MFGKIKKLENSLRIMEYNVKTLEIDVFKIKNPCKFKVGDRVKVDQTDYVHFKRFHQQVINDYVDGVIIKYIDVDCFEHQYMVGIYNGSMITDTEIVGERKINFAENGK